ncbi:nucleoside triphosphate pyrophosphohydrolase [Alkaliphilus peptidifermentans]|uniref:Predicted house-cleaning noncanonical NTP pyrophosphatase, all-alpha NTP-PPase (MazG) superfamily n=1 Tax=Alkaliphilus peptidifermentans DSM 18978 TaxID=1120976 RepID=A0A1G5DR58_9FIRM|nr:nucleoside triphosphate pyrophosphohydrolase [Alkaliphilus peptidifermentans]SCY17144.1 Predicted house-cleaning noncanonical NTP pyrophosphatase, all-alpha NTP-PPase (MazG) superfamily [Alkaliphilus peptidifermentans DSM 18978]
MIIYNKLIRDRIPEIIEKSGKKFTIEKLNDEEYLKCLNLKLQEELNEYLEDNSVDELADLVEVIHAILKHKNVSYSDFEKIRLDKKGKRGGFEEKLFLKTVE